MTQDDKKAMTWTAGIMGIVVVLFIIAYAAGWIPSSSGA